MNRANRSSSQNKEATPTARYGRIDEEIVCADCLVHCLRFRHGCVGVQIEREGDDPPDFWVTIEGSKFAAEVTSIVTDQGYRADSRLLKESIQEESKRLGQLNGNYVLEVNRRPRIPNKRSQARRDIVMNAVSFIQSTSNESSTGMNPLSEDTDGCLGIRKLEGKGGGVALCHTEAKREKEVCGDLTHLMQERVYTKREKLEKKGVPGVCAGVILILYDAYGFAGADDVRNAWRNVKGYDWFHSVFWAASFTDRPNELSPENPGRVGCFLYSKVEEWSKNHNTESP